MSVLQEPRAVPSRWLRWRTGEQTQALVRCCKAPSRSKHTKWPSSRACVSFGQAGVQGVEPAGSTNEPLCPPADLTELFYLDLVTSSWLLCGAQVRAGGSQISS